MKGIIQLFRYFLLLILLVTYFNCKEKPLEKVEYETEKKTEKKAKVTIADPATKPLIDLIKNLEASANSFSAEFKMKIQSGENLEQLDKLNGQMFFDKNSGKVKIQLADPFFGLILTQVVSDNKTIKIKMAGMDKIQTQPMGDIKIQDPKTQKIHTIPFSVIYISISRKFLEEFSTGETTFDMENRIVTVNKADEEYRYKFDETNLQNLELFSKPKNIKAVASVIEKDSKNLHPPKKLGTRVTRMSDNVDTNRIEIEYLKVKRMQKIPQSVFYLK